MANELNQIPSSNVMDGMTGEQLVSDVIQGSSTLANQPLLQNVTRANFSSIGELIVSNNDWRNAFIYTLWDKIGLYWIAMNEFNNPLKFLKKDYLRAGAVVDELQMDLIEPMPYNPEVDWNKALANYVPTYLEMFHKINRRDVFPLTNINMMLRQAFSTPQTFMEMVNKQLSLLAQSNEASEFEEFVSLIQYVNENIAYKVQIAGFTDKDSIEDSVATIRQWAIDLQYPSRDYNVAGFKRSAPYSELVLIAKSDALSQMDVKSLAAAFNMSKADFIAERIVTIPSFIDMGDCEVLLGDRRVFQIYDVEYATDSNHNGLTRADNYFLHVQQILSSSICCPVIGFKAETVTATVLGDFTPATGSSLKKGSTQLIKCAVTSGDNKQLHYSVTGNAVPETAITTYGLLHVGQLETAGSITVTCTAPGGVTKQATYTITS